MSELPILLFIAVPLILLLYVGAKIAVRNEKNPYYWVRYELPVEVWEKIKSLLNRSMENAQSKNVLPQFPKEILKHTCQIFEIKNGDIKNRGTGVLVQSGENYFLVSAAHVLEKNILSNLRVPNGKKMISLYGHLISNVAPESGKRDYDPIDMAILKLERDIVDDISFAHSFLPTSRIWPGIYHNSNETLTISGFPSDFTQRGVLDNGLEVFRAKQVAFKTNGSLKETILIGGDVTKTVKISYDLNSFTINSLTGEPIQLPDAGAFSGSGIWSIDPKNPDSYYLVAIATSYMQEPVNVIAGTQTYIFKEAIKKLF